MVGVGTIRGILAASSRKGQNPSPHARTNKNLFELRLKRNERSMTFNSEHNLINTSEKRWAVIRHDAFGDHVFVYDDETAAKRVAGENIHADVIACLEFTEGDGL